MNPHAIDAQYRSFPPFAEWARYTVDMVRWERYTSMLKLRGDVSPEQLEAAREVVRRAAAVDTGAIEGLYEVDRGFTYTVATQAAIWEAEVDAKGPKTRALIESQLRAYDYVLDLATQAEPISEAFIRTLHTELCRAQETYSVATEVGPQVHQLPLGVYKHLPNHVLKADGTVHAYAPVDQVPAEMHRLMEVLRSDEFLSAHPVLQASYAHYAFILIHPFADGNGRVARAIASVFTYRAQSVPLLILADQRLDYFDALEKADGGDGQAFVDFIGERIFDSIQLANESIQTAATRELDEELEAIDSLYGTRGSKELNRAGISLLEVFARTAEVRVEQLGETRKAELAVYRMSMRSVEHLLPGTRPANFSEQDIPAVIVHASTQQPLAASINLRFWCVVPVAHEHSEDVSLVAEGTAARVFSARVSELLPHATAAVEIRMRIAVERILSRALAEVRTRAAAAIQLPGGSS